MTHLLLTVRFLDDRYHGLLDRGGPPEWPPSPFRLFQALVAGVARRRELVIGDDVLSNTNFTPIGKALAWLQRRTCEYPPIIIAPKSKTGQAINRYGPDNDGDDEDFQVNPEKFRTGKHTEPTLFLLEPDQKPEVHYLWDFAGQDDCPIANIERAARSLTTLGWGIDMAFADARLASMDDIQKLKGIRWYPKKNAGSFRDTLRTPTYDHETGDCTLCDLRQCHDTFVNRIVHGQPLKTVQKPRIFDRVLYTSTERPVARRCAVFRLVNDNEDTFRYPHAKLIHIAGMVRHLAIEAMKNDVPAWVKDDPDWVSRVVRGKRDETEGDQHKQFSYVPLPTIGHPHADAMIRNVMIVAPLGMERELNYLAERLDGLALQPERHAVMCDGHDLCHTEKQTPPLPRIELQKFTPPTGKFISERYLGESDVWETVTPVILDGCNGKSKTSNPEKSAELTVKLIRKALARAGIETPCEFTWQSLPFFPNALSAHKYDSQGRPVYFRPKYLQGFNAVHLRIRFEARVPGPINIGAGRHCGFGLFATSDIR